MYLEAFFVAGGDIFSGSVISRECLKGFFSELAQMSSQG